MAIRMQREGRLQLVGWSVSGVSTGEAWDARPHNPAIGRRVIAGLVPGGDILHLAQVGPQRPDDVKAQNRNTDIEPRYHI